MDTLIQWMVDKFGWGALVLGVLVYLIIEGGLDVTTDEISYRIQRRRIEKEAEQQRASEVEEKKNKEIYERWMRKAEEQWFRRIYG